MFEKVVVCLCGGGVSEQILPYATEEALRFKSAIILLQVYTPPMHGVVTGYGAAERLQKEIEEEEQKIKAYLEGIAQPLRQKGLDVESVILEGNPGEEIVKYAHENEVSLVAIATARRHGMLRVTFGHTADFVLKESSVPVLLVKPEPSEK